MRYVIGGEASVEADQLSWIVPVVGLVPEGCPGVVGPWVSGGVVWSPGDEVQHDVVEVGRERLGRGVADLDACRPATCRCRRPSWSRSARRRGRGSTSRSSRPFRRAPRCANRCPTATPELIDVEEKSERICSVPVDDTSTLTIGPFAALRRRNRSTLLPEARFTFTLRHGGRGRAREIAVGEGGLGRRLRPGARCRRRTGRVVDRHAGERGPGRQVPRGEVVGEDRRGGGSARDRRRVRDGRRRSRCHRSASRSPR